jgi:NAD(P)-dependent dehydrogenase (short-subunit alcohol dehydrogenase family)
MAEVVKKCEKIDVLINCAGIAAHLMLEDLSVELVPQSRRRGSDRHIYLHQSGCPYMKERRYG